MAPVIHEIDPDADTLIILRNPSIVFAPWEEDKNDKTQALRVSMHQRRNLGVSKRLSSKRKMESDMNIESMTPKAGVEPETEPESWRRASAMEHKTPTILSREQGPEESEIKGIQYRVSSRHLTLASPWFKRAMTKEGWSESSRNEEDGLFHITADDWDAEAFLIMLNIFHVRNKKVPRTISLEQLAKIAVLVDYYECGEVLEVFTDMWIQFLKVRASVPSTYCRDLVLWIWVSWVFDVSDYFMRATAVAIKQSEKTLSTLDLPIPAKVFDEIALKRYQAIESVIEQLHALLDEYRAATYSCPHDVACSFQCGSFLLGALTKEMDGMHILSPRPEVPFPNLSFDVICDKVKATKSPSWIHGNPIGYYGGGGNHSCNLNTRVTGIVTKAAAAVTGLNLSKIRHSKASNS